MTDFDQQSMEEAVELMLETMLNGTTWPGIKDTPRRVAKMYAELLSGYRQDPAEILGKTFGTDSSGMVLLSDIPFCSLCEHHLVPFVGTAHVGYIPGEALGSELEEGKYRVVGLSKLARLVECFARRLQLQEQMTHQIADALDRHLAPKGCMVSVQAEHFCMACRGVKKSGVATTTSSIRGVFSEARVRSEFLQFLQLSRKSR